MLGTFAATIALADPLKPWLSTQAVVGIIILPLAVTLLGEHLDEESKSERMQRAGLWLQLGGTICVFGLNIVSLLFAQTQEFQGKVIFYVMVSASMIPLSVLAADCYLGLFRNTRLRTYSPDTVNNWTAIAISAAFVAAFVFIVIKNPFIDLKMYAAGLFFAMCAGVLLNSWWINRQLDARVTQPKMSLIRPFDLLTFVGGVFGALLLVKSWTVYSGFAATYEVAVGAIFTCLALLFGVHKIGTAMRVWRSYVAVREGLLELHADGWWLYPWEAISGAELVTMGASMRAINISLNVDLSSLEPTSRPGRNSASIEQWKKKRLERWMKHKAYYGGDVLLVDPKCLFGIVSMWNATRMALSDSSQRMKLPPASEFTKR